MARAYTAGVLITGNADGAVKATKLTQEQLEKLNTVQKGGASIAQQYAKQIESSGLSLDKFSSYAKRAALAITAGVTAFGFFVKKGLDSADSLGKAADKLGVTTQSLATLRHAANLAGVEQEKLDRTVSKMAVNIGKAASGSGEAAKALEMLGLRTEALLNLPADQQFAKIAGALSNMKNQTDRMTASAGIFGERVGGDMLAVANATAGGLDEVARKVEIAGANLDRFAAAQAEGANDAMSDLGLLTDGLSKQLAVKFSPLLQQAAEDLFSVAEEAGGMGNIATRVFDAIVDGAATTVDWVGEVLKVFRFIGLGLETLFNAVLRGFNELGRAGNHVLQHSAIARFFFGDPGDAGDFDFRKAELDKRLEDTSKRFDALVADTSKAGDAVRIFVEKAARSSEAAAKRQVRAQESVTESVYGTAAAVEDLEKQWQQERAFLNEVEREARRLGKERAAAAEKQAQALADAQEKAAEESARAWQEAANRIDAVFADVWQGAYDSFEDFADSLKQGFKQLLGELAHRAITQPIVMRIAGIVTGNGSAMSGTGTGMGGAGGILSSVGSLFGSGGTLSGIGGALGRLLPGGLGGGFGGGVGGGLAVGGGNVMLPDGTIAIEGASTVPVGGGWLGNLGANVGAGMLGSMVGSGVAGMFSDRVANSSMFATAGGLVGSIWGPLGTGIGAAIGSAIDTLTGTDPTGQRVIAGVQTGTGYAGDSRVKRTVTGASGLSLSAFSRRADDYGAQDLVQSLLDTFAGIDTLLTGAARSAGVSVNLAGKMLTNPDPANREASLGFFGSFAKGEIKEEDVEQAAANFVRAWVAEIDDQLPARVRAIMARAGGTAEEIANAFGFALNIDKLLDLDVVQALDDALEELGQANKSLLARYGDANDALLELGAAYDGSYASLEQLNTALLEQKGLAAQLAVAYRAAGEQIDATFGSAIDQIRESIMSDEEIYNLRRSQISELNAQLAQTIDPEQIVGLVQQIDQLTKSAFGLLDESQQQALAQGFIDSLTAAQQLAQSQIAAGQASLSGREAGVNAAIDLELQRQAANATLAGGQAMLEAAQIIRDTFGGGTYTTQPVGAPASFVPSEVNIRPISVAGIYL